MASLPIGKNAIFSIIIATTELRGENLSTEFTIHRAFLKLGAAVVTRDGRLASSSSHAAAIELF